METYTERIIKSEDLELFRQIEKIIKLTDLPDLGIDKHGRKIEVSCHMLAEAVARIFEVELVRGYYIKGYEHSWVRTKNFNIIDPYPWGTVGSPLLIARQMISRNGPIYITKDDLDFKNPAVDYERAVDLVETSIREAMFIYD